ncbi:MAG: hypothetical protein V4643_13155, partial [Bacteroidota bacterium]
MKNIKIGLVLLVVLLCFTKVKAQQPKVFLPLLETINLKKNFEYASTRLLKNYIDNTNRYQVIMQDNVDSALLNSIESVSAKAKEKGATYFIMGSLNRLGETVIVNINLYETETSKKIWFDQLKAFTPEDLDPVLQRFGQNIGTANKATTADDIYAVTNHETQELRKKESNNNLGVGVGGIALMGDQSSGSVLAGLSLSWSFDARDFIFDIKPSWSFNSTRDVYSLALEVNKPLSDKGNTPYIGGGLAFSRTALSNEQNYYGSYSSSAYASGYGLMLMVGGGYILKRTSSVSLRVSANYLQGLYDVNGKSVYNNLTQSY